MEGVVGMFCEASFFRPTVIVIFDWVGWAASQPNCILVAANKCNWIQRKTTSYAAIWACSFADRDSSS